MARGKKQERLQLAAQHEDRLSALEQALALQFLEQEQQLKEEHRAQQNELFEHLLSLMATRVLAPAEPASGPDSMAGWPMSGWIRQLCPMQSSIWSASHMDVSVPVPQCQVLSKRGKKGKENGKAGDMQQ
ncbi:hypothetical protein KIL84_013087 [Mauremys mutica]|uniref:Uncharacterized protein n=1 Tax=Mauremys mutica TaxID=74926 RepID=A0A9D4B8Y1_9SAUR|nr:hypothetical protein KIL84_013087 [Mauremys mutica]